METQVRTPQMVFMQPQRLIVPLFQRPYVWNEENQWAPLWGDVVRVAERSARRSGRQAAAAFPRGGRAAAGTEPGRLDAGADRHRRPAATHDTAAPPRRASRGAARRRCDAAGDAARSTGRNAEAVLRAAEDQFKVWPTNRDRPAFNAVMGATPPVDYDALDFRGERMVAGASVLRASRRAVAGRRQDVVADDADALERAVRELLQLVVIDLTVDENAQEIFETLNARGAQLTAADLIKNFVFQRLMETGATSSGIREGLEGVRDGFWEAEVSFGRLRYSRSSIFLNHWLIARTGEEIVAREVFARFKSFADFDSQKSRWSSWSSRSAGAPRVPVDCRGASDKQGPIDRLGLFAYRTGVLESEVFKPLVCGCSIPEQEPVPEAQMRKALDVMESWMVRRMLVRADEKSYTRWPPSSSPSSGRRERASAGETVEAFFAGQTVAAATGRTMPRSPPSVAVAAGVHDGFAGVASAWSSRRSRTTAAVKGTTEGARRRAGRHAASTHIEHVHAEEVACCTGLWPRTDRDRTRSTRPQPGQPHPAHLSPERQGLQLRVD